MAVIEDLIGIDGDKRFLVKLLGLGLALFQDLDDLEDDLGVFKEIGADFGAEGLALGLAHAGDVEGLGRGGCRQRGGEQDGGQSRG